MGKKSFASLVPASAARDLVVRVEACCNVCEENQFFPGFIFQSEINLGRVMQNLMI